MDTGIVVRAQRPLPVNLARLRCRSLIQLNPCIKFPIMDLSCRHIIVVVPHRPAIDAGCRFACYPIVNDRSQKPFRTWFVLGLVLPANRPIGIGRIRNLLLSL